MSITQGHEHTLKTNRTDTVQMRMQPKQCSRNSEYSMVWTIRCSIPDSGKMSRQALGSTQPAIQWVPGLFPRGYSERSAKLTNHSNLVHRLKMKSAIPQHLLYVLKVCTQTAFAQLSRHTRAVAGNYSNGQTTKKNRGFR
jgi:hypothetical protein